MCVDDSCEGVEVTLFDCLERFHERRSIPALLPGLHFRGSGRVISARAQVTRFTSELHQCIPGRKSFVARNDELCIRLSYLGGEDLLVRAAIETRDECCQPARHVGVSVTMRRDDLLHTHFIMVASVALEPGSRTVVTVERFVIRHELWPARESVLACDCELYVGEFCVSRGDAGSITSYPFESVYVAIADRTKHLLSSLALELEIWF